jgi:hypothetical protein
MRFMGSVYRKGEIEQLSMTGKIEGRRSRGRQRETYVDRLNMTVENIKRYEQQ